MRYHALSAGTRESIFLLKDAPVGDMQMMRRLPMNTTLTRTAVSVSPRQNGLASRLLQTLLAWQERAHQRHALGQLNGRDLRDLGLSRADVVFEAGKPFWRA
jgi:uncharacterized protein YjiS (DUF1127 family)